MSDNDTDMIDVAFRVVAVAIGVKLFIIPEPASSATGVAIIAAALGIGDELMGVGE